MRSTVAIGLIFTLGLASSVRAAVVVNPDWLRRPTSDQLLAFWPRSAKAAGVGGTALIKCQVTSGGALRGCTVEHETPAGLGFGSAAIAMTPQLAMRPQTVDGRPTDVGVVSIPFSFGGGGGGVGDEVTVLTRPPWIAAPTRADIAAVLPSAAHRGVDGRAVLQCQVTAAGTLRACQTGQAIPSGEGFEGAALRLASKFRVATQLDNGTSTAKARVTVNLRFPAELSRPGAAALAPTLQHSPEWRRLPADDAPPISSEARKAGVLVGRAMVQCRVAGDGALGECVLNSEEPKGFGFGAHAMALASGFALAAWTAEGTPTAGAAITVPLTFRDPPASATASAAPSR